MIGTSQAYDFVGSVLAHNDHFSSHEKDGSMMVAMVPTKGVATLYATVVGDALPIACLVAVVYVALLWSPAKSRTL